jgi:predicted TIM-barrel fold metal-dependent hydrolase
MRILSIARERGCPVIIHTDDDNRASLYAPYCERFPSVRFNLAHGRDQVSALRAMKRTENVYVDCSFAPPEAIAYWLKYDFAQTRIMYGSDLPAPKRFHNISLTDYARKRIAVVRKLAGECAGPVMAQNMLRFLDAVPV